MSSKSKSSSKQLTTQQDNRIVAGENAIAIAGSSGVTINQSDMGLIDRAFTYLTDRDVLAFDQQNAILQKVGSGFDLVLESGQNLLAQAAAAASPTAQQTRFEYLLIAAVALVFLVPVFKGAK